MSSVATIVQSLAWPLTILLIAYLVKDQAFALFSALRRQILAGAEIKFKDIAYKGVPLLDFGNKNNSNFTVESADVEILRRRDETYKIRKNIFLVHRVMPTGNMHPKNGLPTFDISIYLIGHKNYGALNDVKEVQYYFGKYFRDIQSPHGKKYIVKNGNDGFAVCLNAYGPTLCEARVIFHDGSEVMFDRYLDFEGFGYKFSDTAARYDDAKSNSPQ